MQKKRAARFAATTPDGDGSANAPASCSRSALTAERLRIYRQITVAKHGSDMNKGSQSDCRILTSFAAPATAVEASKDQTLRRPPEPTESGSAGELETQGAIPDGHHGRPEWPQERCPLHLVNTNDGACPLIEEVEDESRPEK